MMNIKKKIMVIFATSIMAFSASPFVLAATPAPANNTQQAEKVDTTQQDAANQNNTANQNTQAQIPAAGNAQTQTDTSTQVSNKKYLSKGCILVYIHYYNQCNHQLLDWKQILQNFKER